MPNKPTIHILGAGALGSLWAAKLAPYNNVILLVKSVVHTNRRDFQLVEQSNHVQFSLPCQSSQSSAHCASNTPMIKTLLVFTKSYDTIKALKQLKHRLLPETSIVLFQNGMGSQQSAVELLPDNIIYAASTTEGANRTSDQTVIYAGKGATWLGLISSNATSTPSQQQAIEALIILLRTSTLTIEYARDIWHRLWVKLAINCAINPFTALLDCSNGEIIHHEYFQKNITPLCKELSEAMRLNNIAMSSEDIQTIVYEITSKTSKNISSMLQDVRSKKQTEIDYMNGYINKIAQTHKRTFPVNSELLNEVKNRFK